MRGVMGRCRRRLVPSMLCPRESARPTIWQREHPKQQGPLTPIAPTGVYLTQVPGDGYHGSPCEANCCASEVVRGMIDSYMPLGQARANTKDKGAAASGSGGAKSDGENKSRAAEGNVSEGRLPRLYQVQNVCMACEFHGASVRLFDILYHDPRRGARACVQSPQMGTGWYPEHDHAKLSTACCLRLRHLEGLVELVLLVASRWGYCQGFIAIYLIAVNAVTRGFFRFDV